MFDEYDKPEIANELKKNKDVTFNNLMHSYFELFTVEHEKCNHFKGEAEIIIFNDILTDLINNHKDTKIIENTLSIIGNYQDIIKVHIVRGISMLPESKPGDIYFIMYSKNNNINVGDDVLGYECSLKRTLIHRVVEINDRKIITKGIDNEGKDLLTTDTVFGKIILHIERNTEFWKFLINGLKLQKHLTDCLDYSLNLIEDEIDYSNEQTENEKNEIKKLLDEFKNV